MPVLLYFNSGDLSLSKKINYAIKIAFLCEWCVKIINSVDFSL